MTQTHVKCQKDTSDICEEIKDLIDGSFKAFIDFEFYTLDGENIDLDLVSREIKQFGVILYLLEHKGIPEKSVMILDRIEKDMSRTYQKKLAEILVKLTLRLDLILVINTDSDNFISELDKFKGDALIKTYEAVENGGKYIFH